MLQVRLTTHPSRINRYRFRSRLLENSPGHHARSGRGRFLCTPLRIIQTYSNQTRSERPGFLWVGLLKQNFNTAAYTAANGVRHRATVFSSCFSSWRNWDSLRFHRGPTVHSMEQLLFPSVSQLEKLEFPLEYTSDQRCTA